MPQNFNRVAGCSWCTIIGAFAKETTLSKAHSHVQVCSSIVGRNNFDWRVAIISQLRRVTRDDWRSTDVAVFISRALRGEIGIHWSYNRGESRRESCELIFTFRVHVQPLVFSPRASTNRIVIHACDQGNHAVDNAGTAQTGTGLARHRRDMTH